MCNVEEVGWQGMVWALATWIGCNRVDAQRVAAIGSIATGIGCHRVDSQRAAAIVSSATLFPPSGRLFAVVVALGSSRNVWLRYCGLFTVFTSLASVDPGCIPWGCLFSSFNL